jgi:hypothetical protein
MRRFPSLLDDRYTMLLRAAVGKDSTAADAYRSWRASEKFDETDDAVYRIMPLLLATAERAGLEDQDSGRMRGVVKHIWLSNMLRLRDLADAKAALDAAGIDALLIKGGALFARNNQFAAMRAAGDYDLQVRRSAASRAIQALKQASFHCPDMRLELFSEPDFDRNIHAVAMTKTEANAALDLHWRPLPTLYHEGFVEELFAHAETAELFGQKVLIPGLADHLFIAAVRPEPWDTKEIFLRAMEMAHLLRSCGGQLDWVRFEAVVARYGMGWIAAPLLGLVRDETGAPMPAGLVERIWRNAMPGKALELSFRRLPPEQRGPWQKFFLSFLETLRSQLQHPFSWWRLLIHPSLIFRAFAASESELPVFKSTAIKRIWARRAINNIPVGDRGISFVQGFSFPEQGGRWTDAEFAVIEVAAAAPENATIKTELSIVPFLPPGAGAFKFEIYTGAGEPQRYELTSRDQMPFRLEVEAVVAGTTARKIVIVLRMPNLISPNEIGHSTDPRLLGLFIESVRNIPVTARAEGDARQ